MVDFFTVALVVLFVLAVADLAVGVSNDAVNFLNSAIGSRVATRRTILIIASIGIFLGATFSSGMMEVARKGIFNPEMFLFEEIMIIFLAVMITDVLLLDLFNTFGMPTSTTVSIVFELLGAATAIALIKMSAGADTGLASFINTASALTIITGIVLSVVFAFIIGAFVMYLSRLLFTFDFQGRLGVIGALWAGLALTALTYFILIKGLKGASFAGGDVIDWMKQNTWTVLAIAWVFWSAISLVFMYLLRLNVLKVVVLAGTFSIALAFAGNDLVNFIGVPLAGLSSYEAWQASGSAPDALHMSALAEPVRSSTTLLLIAGGIMVLALWTSKKARSVTETEINLGRQDDGVERFSPGMFSRSLVRGFRAGGSAISAVTPKSLLAGLDKRLSPANARTDADISPPAFDLVRASVNLTVASILIAFATSLKLPLSTTYVTFMVAMGTSLADRAWGRDTAAHRVAGVVSVVGGWFLTAAIAFVAAGTVALLLDQFHAYALAGLVVAVIAALVHSNRVHKRRALTQTDSSVAINLSQRTPALVIDHSAQRMGQVLNACAECYQHSLSGLQQENRRLLRSASGDIAVLLKRTQQVRHQLLEDLKHIAATDLASAQMVLRIYDLEQDLTQSASLIATACRNHVLNSHRPLQEEQSQVLATLSDQLSQLLRECGDHLVKGRAQEHGQDGAWQDLRDQLEQAMSGQVTGFAETRFSHRNMTLITTLLLETLDMLNTAEQVCRLFAEAKPAESAGPVAEARAQGSGEATTLSQQPAWTRLGIPRVDIRLTLQRPPVNY